MREWLALDEVKLIAEPKRRDLEDITEHAANCYAPGKVHMRKFADEVRRILAAE